MFGTLAVGTVGVPVNAGDARSAPPTPVTSEDCSVTAPVRELKLVTPLDPVDDAGITPSVAFDTRVVPAVVDCATRAVAPVPLDIVTVNAPVVRFRNVHLPVVGTVTTILAVRAPVNVTTGTPY